MKEDNNIIDSSHLGTKFKTQFDTNGIMDNTTVRKLVLIYKNREFHHVLSTIHVSKSKNIIIFLTMNKMFYHSIVIQFSTSIHVIWWLMIVLQEL